MTDHDFNIVLFQSSDCQRVVATREGKAVLISKEWRKSASEDWQKGKGITLPETSLIDLASLCKCEDQSQLDELLTGYDWA